MVNLIRILRIGLCVSIGCLTSESSRAGETEVDRGREFVMHRPLNPPVWSKKAYDNAWRQWGIKDKPADYARAFQEHYGLVTAPFDNQGFPMGLVEARGILGAGLTNNCLLCHAGRIAGRTVIGMPNASLDLQSLFEDLTAAEGYKLQFPFTFSNVRGTIDPISPVIYLIQARDTNLDLQKPVTLDLFQNVCSDPPAWWLLKRKTTRDWTGGIDARSTRVDMANLLSPLNSGARIREQEPVFAAIHAFLLTVQAPPYPFAVDRERAKRGEHLFVETCARCHGSYGPGGKYPNKVVELDVIGTDPLLAESFSKRDLDYINKTWLAKQVATDGTVLRLTERHAYQAPPLDGVWATAPYFHNSSTPTLYHVLNSRARPKVFTRSYGTEEADYDSTRVGWKIQELAETSASRSDYDRRRIYDTTLPGRSNRGHTFGDDFSEDERMAVIEYLKTL